MANIFIRTIILYLLLVLFLRLSGKREVGQLELTELVTTFMISELASIPITNNNIPLLYGIIPAATLICLEVFLSFAGLKSAAFSKLMSGTPAILISKGVLSRKELFNSRLTLSELMSSLRVLGVSQICDVEYAILEPSGKLSVVQKAKDLPPSREDMNIKTVEKGIEHIIVADGKVMKHNLAECGFDEKWLKKTLASKGCKSHKEVFFMGINDAGQITVIKSEKGKGKN